MPIYEYRCPNGHVFELFKKMDDPAPEACEVCGASPVELVLYPVAIHYKGSGFYATDYGKKGSKRKAGSESSSPEGGASGSGDGAGGGSGSKSGSGEGSTAKSGESSAPASKAGS